MAFNNAEKRSMYLLGDLIKNILNIKNLTFLGIALCMPVLL